jgi:iron-sulfur cluster repair protein YtfE (RIC family)
MPSDAVDMLVVHRVFRREFHDMPRLISAVLTRDTARAKIVADHVTFMVAALHHHHAAEDDMVWPKLRSRAPAHQAAVERMEEEHTEIAAAVDHVSRSSTDRTALGCLTGAVGVCRPAPR